MSSTRGRRALYQGAWAFALTLLLLSVIGFVQVGQALREAQRQQAALLESLALLEDSLLQMERALLGLAHADSARTRFAGYDPLTLHQTLKAAHRQAEVAIRHILTHQEVPTTLQPTLIRLELEWAQTQAQLAEHIASPHPNRVSLMLLRAFSFRGQDTLGDALRAFRAEYLRFMASTQESETRVLLGYGVSGGLSLLTMLFLAWLRWGLPARWMQCALDLPACAARCERRLKGTEWETVYRTLRFQAQRLREVETFMRDVAMGRTPQPIQPTDPADSLARSSEWLLKRIEQLQSEHRKVG